MNFPELPTQKPALLQKLLLHTAEKELTLVNDNIKISLTIVTNSSAFFPIEANNFISPI